MLKPHGWPGIPVLQKLPSAFEMHTCDPMHIIVPQGVLPVELVEVTATVATPTVAFVTLVTAAVALVTVTPLVAAAADAPPAGE